MTREEFLEKYGEVEVKFDKYYKYSFTYTGVVDDEEGILIEVSFGGDAGDIYRETVEAGIAMKVGDLWPNWGKVTKMGEEVDKFSDFGW